VNLLLNDKMACISNATYGVSANGLPGNASGKEWQTITKMHECDEPIPVKKGDKIKITATYDMKAHPA
jgi:hypothetical protein